VGGGVGVGVGVAVGTAVAVGAGVTVASSAGGANLSGTLHATPASTSPATAQTASVFRSMRLLSPQEWGLSMRLPYGALQRMQKETDGETEKSVPFPIRYSPSLAARKRYPSPSSGGYTFSGSTLPFGRSISSIVTPSLSPVSR
jgi:hypothetical protein